MNNQHNDPNEFLESLLNEYARNLHEYSNGVPGHHNDYREQTDQAKQALLQWAAKERLDELKHVDLQEANEYWVNSEFGKAEYDQVEIISIRDRIAQLTKEKP